jgi:hypothetical protein
MYSQEGLLDDQSDAISLEHKPLRARRQYLESSVTISAAAPLEQQQWTPNQITDKEA